jgi:hypothetical protein
LEEQFINLWFACCCRNVARRCAGRTTTCSILSDVFCTGNSLADPDWKLPISSTSLLTAPETHKFACFYGMKVCRDSGYDLLVEGADSTYEIGHRLSDGLNDKVRAFLVGLPDEVKTQAGFVVQITGAVVYDHDDDSAAFGAHCGDEISIIGLDGTEGSAGLAELLASGDNSGSGDDEGDDEAEVDDDDDDSAFTAAASAVVTSASLFVALW